jgi:type VI secretion system protein ImpE
MTEDTDHSGSALRAGDLSLSLAAAAAAVRAKPRDVGPRWRLAEILLFLGDIERADRVLDAVISDQPIPAVLEFRRLLRAEEQRRQCALDGRVPKFQGDDPTAAQRATLQALTLSRLGEHAEAASLVAEAEAARPRCAGNINGGAFDDFRDADDLFAAQLEILTTAGDYMWVPTERLRRIELEASERPRDLYWRRCNIELKDGASGTVYLPAIYLPPDGASDALRLGRETAWSEGNGLVRGYGQRLWLAGEAALMVSQTHVLDFV